MNLFRSFRWPSLLLILIFSAKLTWAETDPFAKGTQAFRRGDYTSAAHYFEAAERAAQEGTQALARAIYWEGLAFHRLQSFESALQKLDRAAALGWKSEEFHFERGQALLALGRLKPAAETFRLSAAQGYKPAISQYYQAYILQQQGDSAGAIALYSALVRLGPDPEKVKPGSLFQIGEIRLAYAEKLPEEAGNEAIRNLALPFYRAAIRADSTSWSAHEARDRIAHLEGRLAAWIPRFENGVPIPVRPWYARANQEFRYDSNVVTQSDESVSQVSNAASAASKTSIAAKYQRVFGKRWAVSPEAALAYLFHFNRSVPEVFQNDSLTADAALRTRREHQWLGEPAATFFDTEFNYTARDYLQNHAQSFYTRYFNFQLGERFRPGKAASMTLTAGFRFLTHEDPAQSFSGPSLSLLQNFRVDDAAALSLNLYTELETARDSFNSRNLYRATASYIRQEIFWGLDLGISLDVLITDTKEQRATRGWEKMLTPSVSLSRVMLGSMSVALSYAYTRNFSNETTTYAYTRGVSALSVGYTF